MEAIISKQEFEQLIGLEGKTRGVGFKTEEDFILNEEGKEGLERLEKTMADLGFSYDKISIMGFYPIGWLAVALLVIERLFGYNAAKFEQMGSFEAKSSLIIKMFMKYFVSLDKVAKEAPNMWRKYYTVGNVVVKEMDEKGKRAVITINDFSLHPNLCPVLKGYFLSIIKMIVRSEISCQEVKCAYKGDDCHEFVITWQ